ncbi:MAG: phage infection protein, partial [Candidatus Dadabacteria bacterium]|nr:phage infection protein [Candidatus Dadabacteria bacterium]
MQKIKVHFENCYGIKVLNAEFDFSDKHANLIYAPNGAMKTSFAQTFKDHSEGNASQDRVYPERRTIREITDQNDVSLSAETVFVIEPYDPSYESGRVSTLLANSALKSEYDDILKGIEKKSSELMTLLRKTSGVRSGLEKDAPLDARTRAPGRRRGPR